MAGAGRPAGGPAGGAAQDPGDAGQPGRHALPRRGGRRRRQCARFRRLATAAARRAGAARLVAARRPRRRPRAGPRREQVFAHAAAYLAAAEEAAHGPAGSRISTRWPRSTAIEPDAFRAWLDYLGIGSGDAVRLQRLSRRQDDQRSGYDFINGWGNPELPQLLANSSDQHVRVPGNMKPHSVAVHPSPTLRVAVGWRSPVDGAVRLEGGHARASRVRQRRDLVARAAARADPPAAGRRRGAGSKGVKIGPIEEPRVQTGDLVSLLIGPRDGNHACDLTAIDLTLTRHRCRRSDLGPRGRRLARRAGRQPARGPVRQRRPSGTSTPSPTRAARPAR